MNEKEFMQDLWDVLRGNTQYITQEKFTEQYDDLFVEVDCDKGEIKLTDGHNEWVLSVRKVWCDETQVNYRAAKDCAACK